MNERLELVGDIPNLAITREIGEGRTYDLYRRVPSDLAKDLRANALDRATRVIQSRQSQLTTTVGFSQGCTTIDPTLTPTANAGDDEMDYMPIVPHYVENRAEYLATLREQERQAPAAANKQQPASKWVVNEDDGTCHREGETQRFALVRPPEYFRAREQQRRELYSHAH